MALIGWPETIEVEGKLLYFFSSQHTTGYFYRDTKAAPPPPPAPPPPIPPATTTKGDAMDWPRTVNYAGQKYVFCSEACARYLFGPLTLMESAFLFKEGTCNSCKKLIPEGAGLGPLPLAPPPPPPPPTTTARDRVLAGYRDEIDVYTEARELAIHHNRTRDIKQLGDIIAAIKYMIDQIELSAPSKITGGLNADNR